jgi:ribosomal protein S27AE
VSRVRIRGGGGEAIMWRFKSCPKCGGDVFIDRDMNGWYEQCLQCGYIHDMETIVEVKEQPRMQHMKKREPVLAGHQRRR